MQPSEGTSPSNTGKTHFVDKWNDYMEDVLDLVMDPETGAQPKLRMMFKME